jgi:threonine dehydrogenase-like Zn-dependent dehydrogenase
VGEVLAAGADAGVQPGDLVLAHTPHQSAVRFDARRTVCVRVPEGIPSRHAPMARLGQVSAVSIRAMHARPGDRAAVTGLGVVGNCAAQLLRCAGLQVLGVETLPERRALAERCGIANILDPGMLPAREGTVEGVNDSCAVVLECSGKDRGVLTALALAARHGEVFLVGAAWKRSTTVVASDILRPIFDKFLALRGGWEWQIPLYRTGPSDSIAGCTEWVLGCMHDGTLRVADLITDVVAPSTVQDAYADLLAHPEAHMGVLIDWRRP